MPVNITDIVKPIAANAAPPAGMLSDAWQAILGDRIAAYRLMNAAKLQQKVLDEVKANGLSLNLSKIPDRYAFAWFETATKEDDDSMQTLFSRLLARAATGDTDAQDRRLIDLLSRLTPEDASCFALLGSMAGAAAEGQEVPYFSISEFRAYKLFSDHLGRRAWKPLDQLVSAGALEKRSSIKRNPMRLSHLPRVSNALDLGLAEFDTSKIELQDNVRFTALGWALYQVVTP